MAKDLHESEKVKRLTGTKSSSLSVAYTQSVPHFQAEFPFAYIVWVNCNYTQQQTGMGLLVETEVSSDTVTTSAFSINQILITL